MCVDIIFSILVLAVIAYFKWPFARENFSEERRVMNKPPVFQHKQVMNTLEGLSPEPLSDRMKFRQKNNNYSDEDLLILTLSRTNTPVEDEIANMEIDALTNSAILGEGDSLDDEIMRKQKKSGKSARRNTRAMLENIKEDYAMDFVEDNEPWWTEDPISLS